MKTRWQRILITMSILTIFCIFISLPTYAKDNFKHKRTGEPISIIKCSFDKTASFWIGTKEYTTGIKLIDTAIRYITNIFSKSTHFLIGNEKAKLDLTHDKDFSFIISGLDTDEPKMKGNLGEAPLNILWKTDNTIYLAELSPFKNAINYITLFPKRNIVIYSKQYEMLPSGKSPIAAYMCVGHFE